MVRSTSSMANLLVKHWAGAGEQVVHISGFDGYVASAVRGAHRIPHRAVDPGVRVAQDHRVAAIPMEVLRDGAFLGDELVHDPGLRGYARAGTPNDHAVRFADGLTATGSVGFLAVTGLRVGVLVETTHLEAEQPEADPESPANDVGSVFDAVKSAVRARTSRRGDEPANPVTSACEAPMTAIREITPVALGRSGEPVRFLRFAFQDGSELDVKHSDPAHLAETIRLNRR